MIKINRILVPLDFSDFSDRALEYGLEFCNQWGAELHLFHVLEVHVTDTPQYTMGVSFPDRQQETEEEAIKKLNEYVKDGVADNVQVVRKTAQGSPYVEIIRYCKQNEIDMVIAGTHGRTGLQHVFMGSVAENVVRHATCPVLTVRKEGHHFIEP